MRKPVLVLLGVLCLIFSTAASEAEEPRTLPRLRFHSHNDYEQCSPLFNALKHGLHSVEVDVWYTDGQWPGLLDSTNRSIAPTLWRVSHSGFSFVGTLERLYLKPLERLIKANNGSVFGDGQTFFLWIEFKQGDEFLTEVMHGKLVEYASILYVGGPVQVVLTGEEDPKKLYTRTYNDLAVMRDSHKFYKAKPFAEGKEVKPMYGWGWYSRAWSDIVSWNGKGKMPDRERQKLRNAVAFAHKQKRSIRLFHSPDKPSIWTECLNAGVDLVSVDNLAAAEAYLR
jgi:hypothetical protein